MDGIALLIDGNLTITMVGRGNWNEFSARNGGANAQGSVVGRDITSFFSPGEFRDTYRKLFCAVLERRRGLIRLDYRCDSAAIRRSMRLTVTLVQGAQEHAGQLLYQSTTVSEEQRPTMPLFEALAMGTDKTDLLKICCICARVQWPAKDDKPSSEWMEPQEYYRSGGEDVVMKSHGFCPTCYVKVLADDA